VGIDREVFGFLATNNKLEVYEQRATWVLRPTQISTGYQPVLDENHTQRSQLVRLETAVNSSSINGSTRRATTGPWKSGGSGKHLEVYEQRWAKVGEYDQGDYVALNNPATQNDVTLADGTTGVDLTAFRLRTGTLYDDIPSSRVAWRMSWARARSAWRPVCKA